MHKQDFSQQFVREKALHRYLSAFERGDFDIMDEVLQQAMIDPLLEEMIIEAHKYMQSEEQVTLREEDAAKILDLVVEHLPSGIPDEEQARSVPPLTMSDVFTNIQEDATLPGSLKQEAQRLHAILPPEALPVPEQLGLKDVALLFAHLNMQVSARLQKVFRDKAIFLAMGHQRGMAQLAAARRQKTQHQQAQKTGKERRR